jgi:restriction system protein
MPIYHELLWPTLDAITNLGGSATIQEINEQVISDKGFSEEQQAVPHASGRQSEIEYRLAWARSNLKGLGAVENSARGVWSVTEHGRSLTPESVLIADKEWRAVLAARRRERSSGSGDLDGSDDLPDLETSWKDELIARLLLLTPDAFERLAQRLLREAGFTNVTVTGRSGDRGIDGIGVYRLTQGLVSFPVFFQCKRYTDSVGPGPVRDFRGAMSGRGEKGLLITTSNFTRDAMIEATRDGAPPVELIDGDRLCDLLKEFKLGVETRQRIEEDVDVVTAFFDEI